MQEMIDPLDIVLTLSDACIHNRLLSSQEVPLPITGDNFCDAKYRPDYNPVRQLCVGYHNGFNADTCSVRVPYG